MDHARLEQNVQAIIQMDQGHTLLHSERCVWEAKHLHTAQRLPIKGVTLTKNCSVSTHAQETSAQPQRAGGYCSVLRTQGPMKGANVPDT